MQILTDPTHPVRHYFDSRHGNRNRFLLLRTNANRYKATFLSSVEDDNFLRDGWGCVNLMIFIWEFLRLGLTEKALFQVILGLLLVYADWEKGGIFM